MASRLAARFVSRRMSSSGRILSEEEKAAENVYIKKIEQEKLEKLARKEDKPTAGAGDSITDAKPSGSSSTSGASTAKVSTDKYRNYAVGMAAATAQGWYLKECAKKPEVQD